MTTSAGVTYSSDEVRHFARSEIAKTLRHDPGCVNRPAKGTVYRSRDAPVRDRSPNGIRPVCGIVGAVHFDNRNVSAEVLRRMVAQLHHRGPDAAGVHVDRETGLGHARLSIIDPAGGSQPMTSRDRSLTVTFNGEIFNYIELRRTLIDKGHRFATKSDTEVILHAYQQYGEDCVRHFNGQWAFAVWDRNRRTLFVSRDRLGIRPLYYTMADGVFLLASEIKALFVHPGVSRAIDPVGLDQVFTFWSTLPPRTVFEGIRELPPGHSLSVKRGEVRVARYWQLDYDPQPGPTDTDQWAGQLLDLLTDATRLRLRSDVPVGAYLSGGLDSTVNAALVRRCTSANLRTFSIAFEDAEFDESNYQEQAVAFLGTEHRTIRCSPHEIGRVFPDVIRHAEQPVLRTAPAPLYLLSKLVNDEGFKVVLTGEGADEMLGGYDIFKEAKVRRFWAADPGSTFRAALLRKLYPYLPNLQVQSPAYQQAFFHVSPEDLANPFFSHLPRWRLTSRLKSFFSGELRSRLEGHDAYDDCRDLLPAAFADWPPFCQAQYLETVTLMPGYILSSQGDRAAMAHSVEGRFPFLDHRVAEFAARIPLRLKMNALQEKYLLKRATRRLVPEAVTRRTKQPYRAPDIESFFNFDDGSFRHDYAEELLSPRRIADDGLFHPGAVERLVEKARNGRAVGIKDNMALVGILSTQLVIDRFGRDFQPAADTTRRHLDIASGPGTPEDGYFPPIEPTALASRA